MFSSRKAKLCGGELKVDGSTVVGDANRAGKVLLMLLVDDLENHIAELRQRGLEPSASEAAPGRCRKAIMTDPEGDMLSLGENLSTDA